jgi:hypothetical protein
VRAAHDIRGRYRVHARGQIPVQHRREAGADVSRRAGAREDDARQGIVRHRRDELLQLRMFAAQ